MGNLNSNPVSDNGGIIFRAVAFIVTGDTEVLTTRMYKPEKVDKRRQNTNGECGYPIDCPPPYTPERIVVEPSAPPREY